MVQALPQEHHKLGDAKLEDHYHSYVIVWVPAAYTAFSPCKICLTVASETSGALLRPCPECKPFHALTQVENSEIEVPARIVFDVQVKRSRSSHTSSKQAAKP